METSLALARPTCNIAGCHLSDGCIFHVNFNKSTTDIHLPDLKLKYNTSYQNGGKIFEVRPSLVCEYNIPPEESP